MKAFRVNLLLFALPALLAGLAPAVFAYDRTAILHGEWWRLWTGHWVHFSFSHLAWDLVVVLVAGTWLEWLSPGLLGRFALLGAPIISLGLLALAPAMHTYGGLSALATGLVVLLALNQLQSRRSDHRWWLALLGLVLTRIFLDVLQPDPLLSRIAGTNYQTAAAAHVLGTALALAVFLSPTSAFRSPLSHIAP